MTITILIENQTNTQELVKNLILGNYPELPNLSKHQIGVFSKSKIDRYIEEEELHDKKILTKDSSQSLKSMSSGERKKMLLAHLLENTPEVLLLVNPYDNLDQETQTELKTKFESLAAQVGLVQIISRISDALPSTTDYFVFKNGKTKKIDSKETLVLEESKIECTIPQPLKTISAAANPLIEFKNVNVSFDGRQVLQDINWTICPSEFWQLKGPNGSGKSTLLNMITGDSHKGYGQDLTLFGNKKGSGESVWEIKQLIGYFTPAMVDRFEGYHTLKNMLISGLHDSVGLYYQPSEIEQSLSKQWLQTLNLTAKKDQYFHQLSQGEKRLIMTARAMIKHPPLLILDEPTVGLDDRSASFFVGLVNAYAAQSSSTVIFVSHRTEKGLQPNKVLELVKKNNGSVAVIQ